MNRKALVTIIAGSAMSVLVLAGCSSSGGGASGQSLEQSASNNIEKSFLLNQPPPHFQHSDIRATAISIEAIQALGEQTTTFFFNQGVKNPIMTCPSLGEPVASTTEITNPQQIQNDSYPQYGAAVPIGNMDPNGIYAGGSTGTYVLCVNAQGQQYASYWEGFVESVSGPATWDAASGTIKVTGAPTMPRCTVAQAATKKAATTCVE